MEVNTLIQEAAYRTAGLGYNPGLKTPAMRFTGKERDSETGLDLFGARYLSGVQGRFSSADMPFADQITANPQSWNLYSYARNNPLRNVDPNGRCSQDANGGYWDHDNAETLLFSGACANGVIGETKPPPELEWWDIPGQWFVGLGDFAFNNKPSGLGRMAYAYAADAAAGFVIASGLRAGGRGWAALRAGEAAAEAAPAAVETFADGSFSIIDWTGYPAGVPAPPVGTTYRLLEGTEYETARALANQTNAGLRATDPAAYAGKEIHEIVPVKFGGSPTDLANKVAIPTSLHRQQVTPWWNRVQRAVTGGN